MCRGGSLQSSPRVGARTAAGYHSQGYVVGEALGRGAHATVYAAVHAPTGRQCAIKVAHRGRTTRVSEVECLQCVHHPGVLALHDTFVLGGRLHMVMERFTGGDLFSYLVEHGSFPEAAAASIVRQVLTAVAALHAAGVCHRDIKPENVVLRTGSEKGAGPLVWPTVALADFGLAARFTPGAAHFTDSCGTLSYMAPELLAVHQSGRGEYTEKVDIWAVGVLAYNLLFAQQPFFARFPAQLRQKIRTGDFSFPRGSEGHAASAAARSFIATLLAVTPAARPSAAEALAHPWLAGAEGSEGRPASPGSCSTVGSSTGEEDGRGVVTPRRPETQDPDVPEQCSRVTRMRDLGGYWVLSGSTWKRWSSSLAGSCD